MWRPSRQELAEARGRTLPDVIAPGLRVLFCGINPSLYSAAVGHHFARPGNRFWPALHRAGFTPRLLSPFEEGELLPLGYGITNLVRYATARADEIARDDLERGARTLVRKVRRYRPAYIAVLGVGSSRDAFGVREGKVGEQAAAMAGARVWVLPNPSGLNAHYQLPDLIAEFRKLRVATEAAARPRSGR